VKIASKFKSRIKIACGRHCVDGKSLMALLTLAASYGMDVNLIAEGEDAHQALNAIKTLLESHLSHISGG